MQIPEHRNKAAEEILDIQFELDSATYFYIAACWSDFYVRSKKFQTLLNAAINARMGIEYLLFEEIILSSEQGFTEDEYKLCLKDKRKLEKVLKKSSPEYEKLKEFTRASIKLESKAPRLIFWNIKKLMKQWGTLSSILHWSGAHTHTTSSKAWLIENGESICGVIDDLWKQMSSGQSAILNVRDMKPDTKLIWEDFRSGKIDAESVTKRLEIMQPIIKRQSI